MNTLNVCLGHIPFPKNYSSYIDIFLSPTPIEGSKINAIIPDNTFGEHGHSLSEYAQLIWLSKNIDLIAPTLDYIRIFHYRRFSSPFKINGTPSLNGPWITTIQENSLDTYKNAFNRTSHGEIFNSRISFDLGVITQYANNHVLEDLLNFTNFLVNKNIMSATDACNFLRTNDFIPACNVGVFSKVNFKIIYFYIQMASDFLNSENFKARDGYQRRSMGFLLERFHSFLLFQLISQNYSTPDFGHNIMISDSPIVTSTIERVSA